MNIKDLLEYNWYSRRRILKSMTELPWEQVTPERNIGWLVTRMRWVMLCMNRVSHIRETFHPWASADGQDQDGGARRFSHASAGCFSNHPCAPAYNPFCSPNPRQPLRPDPVGPNFYSAGFPQISPLLQASRWAVCLRLILV